MGDFIEPFDTTGEPEAVKAMVAWFIDHYEPPEESTTRDDGEWFWRSGPHSADEVLREFFGSTTTLESDIVRATDILERECSEWAKKNDYDEDDNYLEEEPEMVEEVF